MFFVKKEKERETQKKKWSRETFSHLKTKCRECHWRETYKKNKKKEDNKENKRKNKGKDCFFLTFLDHFLPPDGFVSIQIQMVVWHVNNLDCWLLFISPLGLLLYPRYAMHVLECGSEKSSIATHISTCFLVNFVCCCFLSLDLFIPCSFISFTVAGVFIFSFFYHVFISFPSLSFFFSHFFPVLVIFCFFSWNESLPIQTTCISIHCLLLLNMLAFMQQAFYRELILLIFEVC